MFQAIFCLPLLSQQIRIEQSRLPTVVGLPAVLHSEQIFPRLAGVFLGSRAISGQKHFHAVETLQRKWNANISLVFEFRHGHLAAGSPGMSRDEDQFPICGTVGTPFQIVLDLSRLPILVNPEETNIQIVARVLEIVRIAAIERDLLFGSENQPHISVFLEPVKLVGSSLVEGNDIAAQPRFIERFLLDGGLHRAAGGESVLRVHLGFDRGIHSFRDIFDADQHVQLEIKTPFFFLGCARVKTFAHVIMIFITEFLQRVRAHMVVRHDQSRWRNERARPSAIETHGRPLNVIEPLVGGVKTVLFLELTARRVIEKPHAFVGDGREAGATRENAGD